ncbi:MAG TPA: multidrug ABC transporter ATP-binding protein [Gammaproteobacteria bacterium]|nr:multidrug ABC transporter ATP-binding protein [Gammaproteobacteria bacterium]
MPQNCCFSVDWGRVTAVSPETAIIETENLTKMFKDVVAVDDLNLQISKGEIFGLVGPDGAGKTTTIRLLVAILDPDSGWAKVDGYDTVREPEPIKSRIGYMAQQFNLYGDLSVWENLNFFADVFEITGQERSERIERLLNFARLNEFRDRRAAHLSGGMQKKLALACTLIHTPDIIYLDEPTTGVDPVSRREFWDILTELHLDGITLFISTPYMDEAERCSRVGLMNDGKLIVCDRPEKIKRMISGELITLWPSDMRRALPLILDLDGVLEVQTYGDQLRIFAEDAAEIDSRIRDTLSEASIDILDMRRTQPRMEEAFISLIQHQRVEAEEAAA